MDKKVPFIYFIDRLNYNMLQDKNFNINDFYDTFIKSNISNNISLLTKASISYLNFKLNNLFSYNNQQLKFYYEETCVLLSKKEKDYIEDNFNYKQLEDHDYPISQSEKKYYEIIILSDNSILVIVEDSFLKHLTESKDNLLKFILDCLCYQYKFNYILTYIVKVYINLRINDSYFFTIKSRYM